MKFVQINAAAPDECEQFPKHQNHQNHSNHPNPERVLVMCGKSRVFMRLDEFFKESRKRPSPLFTIENGKKNKTAAQVLKQCDPVTYKKETKKDATKRRAFTCYMYVYNSGQWRVLYTMLGKLRRDLLQQLQQQQQLHQHQQQQQQQQPLSLMNSLPMPFDAAANVIDAFDAVDAVDAFDVFAIANDSSTEMQEFVSLFL